MITWNIEYIEFEVTGNEVRAESTKIEELMYYLRKLLPIILLYNHHLYFGFDLHFVGYKTV